MEYQPLVVIVGAGFGGLNAAKALKDAPLRVMLVDKQNYHLFQPLLYQVATSYVSDTDIAYPARAIFRKQKNFTFRLTEVTGVDFDRKILFTTTGDIPYDFLVLAPGGETNYFGMDSIAQHGYGLKNLDDAVGIRNHILKIFELAEQTADLSEQAAMRTFVIVGGGPTGVESAGSLSELIRDALTKDYPELHPDNVHIILLEMTDQLLPGFPDSLAKAAAKRLEDKRVDVRFGDSVTGYDGKVVTLKSGEEIHAYTLIWAAGIRSVSWLDSLGLQQARQGRVVVERTMQVPEHPEVFVVGDAAYLEEEGKGLPMVAPVAIQQGKLAAQNIQRILGGKELESFGYKDPGSLATIGRNAAVARVKNIKTHGFIAWVMWLFVHLFWLIGFRNRLLVLINWAWDYIFSERAVRTITPDGNPSTPEHPWPIDVEFPGGYIKKTPAPEAQDVTSSTDGD